MFVHVTLYLLPQTLQFLVLLLQLVLLGLVHGDHVESDLDLLILGKFEFLCLLFRSQFLCFFLGTDHLVKDTARVGHVASQGRQDRLTRLQEGILRLLQLGVPVHGRLSLLRLLKDVLILHNRCKVVLGRRAVSEANPTVGEARHCRVSR